jgi:hypothetical protein
MTRSKRFQRIVALADVSRREASQHLARSRQVLGTGGSGMSAGTARELRGVLNQIERTIAALSRAAKRVYLQMAAGDAPQRCAR